MGPSSLTGSGDPTKGIFVPSTLEQPSVSSVSTTETGSRATQQGVLPVASSATENHQDGPEVQMFTCPDIHPITCALSSGKSLPPPRLRTHGTEDGLHQGRPSGRRTRSALPVGHVGAHPDSLRASGGQQGSSHLGAQLTSADFRSTGMPSPTSGSAHGPQPEVEYETDASLPEDVVSQAGDEVPHTSGLGLPLGELLALLNEHLPQAFTQEAATTQQSSFFRTLQAAQQPESGALKVCQSLLATSALDKAMREFRGNTPSNLDASGLMIYPSGRKPPSFPRMGRPTLSGI